MNQNCIQSPLNHYCEVCYKTFTSNKQLSYHLDSLNHNINKKKYILYQDSSNFERNIEEFIDITDKCILFNKENYINSCKNLILENGGRFMIDNREYHSLNTCSIDYFLIIIYIIRMNHIDKVKLLKDDISRLFESIFTFLSFNEWQNARLAWLEYCPSLERTIKRKNVYNWFLSEYEAYFSDYRNNQLYSWKTKCDNTSNPLCVNSLEAKKSSYAYIIKFKIFFNKYLNYKSN